MNNQTPKIQGPGTPLSMSAHDFAEWGKETIAYIKQMDMNGQTVFAVCAANGHPLGVMDNRDVAMAAEIQNELEPVSVH